MNYQEYKKEYIDGADPVIIEEISRAYTMLDACNSSGIVFDLAEVMRLICDEANRLGKGTDWKNKHPLVILYSYKLFKLTRAMQEDIDNCISLAGLYNDSKFLDSYRKV